MFNNRNDGSCFNIRVWYDCMEKSIKSRGVETDNGRYTFTNMTHIKCPDKFSQKREIKIWSTIKKVRISDCQSTVILFNFQNRSRTFLFKLIFVEQYCLLPRTCCKDRRCQLQISIQQKFSVDKTIWGWY